MRFPVRSGDDGAGGQQGDYGARGDVAVAGRGNELGERLGRLVLAVIVVAWGFGKRVTLTGRVGLLDGHDTMKGAASVYTSSRDRGTSNGDGNGLSPSEARM